ncbi:MAG TPA: glycosyl hydrolase family 28-related protein [Candidatus Saccharimonadales bacterium]|nr:glycosyl hydrolase family 28-related protein [Candidatus Saccharimonadales bacterium]
MARLPDVGGDSGNWGTILNDFLEVSLNQDGTILPSALQSAGVITQETSAAGDLSGTYSNPAVTKINGVAITGTPSSGQVLTATNGSTAGWSTLVGTTDWINVKQYGATGNGTTDDSSAIASALAAASQGQTVYLPAGSYLFNASTLLTIGTTGLRISGDGPNATKIVIGPTFTGAEVISVTAGYCGIENLSIIGSSSTITNNPVADGILLQGGRNCRVSNVFFQYINGWCIESVATSVNAGFATMLRSLSGLNCAGGIHIQSNTNVGWGAQHFLSDINFQQIGAATGNSANLDVFRFQDCYDITAVNFNAAISDASSGSTINIVGNCASHYFTNMDLGCFPNGSGTNSIITIQNGANGSPTDIRFVQGEAQQGLTALTVGNSGSDGTHKCFFTNFRFFNNYSDGARVVGSGSDIRFNMCTFDSNGQGASNSINCYDLNWSGSATGSVYLSRYQSNVVALGNVGVQNPVNLASTGQGVPHFLTDFGGSGTTNSNLFTHFPPLVVRTDTAPPSWNGKLTLQSGQASAAILTLINSISTPSVPSAMLQANAAGDKVVGVYVNADSQQRLIIDSNGKLLWGSGSAAGDTNLYRNSAGLLQTDDSLTVSGTMSSPTFVASGLSGATAASRYVGATASGAPTSGTFAVGDFIIDQTANIWICKIAGSPGTWAELTSVNTNSSWQPADSGLASWTCDPFQLQNQGYNPGSGVISGSAFQIRQSTTISKFYVYVQTAGSALTSGQCYGLIYNSSGTLLGYTADQSSNWASVGLNGAGSNTVTLTVASGQSLTLTPGKYWAAVYYNGTSCSFLRGDPTLGPTAVNFGATGSAQRSAQLGTGAGATPPTSITFASGGGPIWFAVS